MSVRFEEVVNGAAVTGYDALKPPFIAENALQITGVSTTRFTVYTLIGTHDFLYVSLLDKSLKGWQIGLP
jgi:hypothetical protein